MVLAIVRTSFIHCEMYHCVSIVHQSACQQYKPNRVNDGSSTSIPSGTCQLPSQAVSVGHTLSFLHQNSETARRLFIVFCYLEDAAGYFSHKIANVLPSWMRMNASGASFRWLDDSQQCYRLTVSLEPLLYGTLKLSLLQQCVGSKDGRHFTEWSKKVSYRCITRPWLHVK